MPNLSQGFLNYFGLQRFGTRQVRTHKVAELSRERDMFASRKLWTWDRSVQRSSPPIGRRR